MTPTSLIPTDNMTQGYNRYIAIIIMAVFCFCTQMAHSQGGQLDPSFNPMDVSSKKEGADKNVRAIAIQADGKILIGGDFTNFNGTPATRIARLLPNGLNDASFNVSGSGADSTIYSIAVQADGKILIAGAFNTYNGVPANYITRLNADGSKDPSFNTGTGPDGPVNVLLLQPNQKILAGGDFLHYNTSETNYLVRINEDGALDASFAATGVNGPVNDIALEASGSIFAGFNNIPYLNRLNSDGSADDFFNASGTGANGPVQAVKVQADGKILIGGFFSLYNNLNTNLTRINNDGTIDPSYDNTAGGLPFGIQKLLVQPDGKIIAATGEYREIYAGGLVEGSKVTRLLSNGLIDPDFKHEFYTELNENVYALALQSDGKLLVAETFVARWGGSASRYAIHDAGLVYAGSRDFRINRYMSDGASDKAFCLNNTQKGANREVLALAQQSDGKTILGGMFFTYNGTTVNYCTRVNSNGSIDPLFNAGGSGFNKKVNAIAIQPDGKIIAGGVFTKYNGTSTNGLIRLNADGTRDLSFNYDILPLNNEVSSLCLQADGKILVGTMGRVYRLLPDGTTDTGFTGEVSAALGFFFPYVKSIAIQADNKIIIGGWFSGTPGGGRLNNIARLNPDGSRDNSFAISDPLNGNFPGADDQVYTIALQPDGKILIGGLFKSYTANSITSSHNYIMRLTTDGFADGTFNAGGTAANSFVNAIHVLSDGKIMIGGNFSSYNGMNTNHLARLNIDGSPDGSFNAGGNGTEDYINALIPVNNEQKILLAGNFSSYNGYGKTRIARIFNSDVPTTTSNVAVCASQLPYNWLGNSYPNPGTYQNTITFPDGSESISTLVLTEGPGNIQGPDRVCMYMVDGETPIYQVSVPTGSVITWSVSKRTTMQIVSGQGTNHAAIRFLAGFTTGTLYVKIVNAACGINITRSIAITTSLPSTPAAITANMSSICSIIGSPNAALYSTRKVTSATAYNWTAPLGASIIHPNGPGVNDTLVYVIFSSSYAGGAITVQSANDCGISNARSITVSRTLPATPGSISGPTNVCNNILTGSNTEVAHYSVPSLPDITYNWVVPAGSEVYSAAGLSTLDIRFPSGFTSGTIAVTAVNGCGSSSARSFNIRALPAAIPGAITETGIAACPDRQYTYSLASMPANADSVIWTVPAGAVILSGQGTSAIIVSYPPTAVSGFVNAYSANHCTISGVRKYTVSLPACPPPIPFAGNNALFTRTATNPLNAVFDAVVFPNPSTSAFRVNVKSALSDIIQYRLLDATGRQLYQSTAKANETIVTGEWLKAGIYLLEIRQGKETKTLRLVKQ